MRLASYNSDVTGVYYYPGFVNQFKDTLLPLCLFYLYSITKLIPNTKISGRFLLFFSLISVFSILGTGQRGAFVLAIMMGGSFIFNILNKKNIRKLIMVSVVPLLFLFSISTFINGRTKSEKLEAGATLTAIVERITSDNQIGALIGFREIMYPRGIQWGSEWWDGIQGFTPSHTGSTLANEIAGVMWGGFGNAPPSNWGSIYYNFGWIGIILYPIFCCFTLSYFYYRLYQKKKYLFRILIYVYCFVIAGTWIAGSPFEYYFNVGLVTVILLKLLYNLMAHIFGKVLIKPIYSNY